MRDTYLVCTPNNTHTKSSISHSAHRSYRTSAIAITYPVILDLQLPIGTAERKQHHGRATGKSRGFTAESRDKHGRQQMFNHLFSVLQDRLWAGQRRIVLVGPPAKKHGQGGPRGRGEGLGAGPKAAVTSAAGKAG